MKEAVDGRTTRNIQPPYRKAIFHGILVKHLKVSIICLSKRLLHELAWNFAETSLYVLLR